MLVNIEPASIRHTKKTHNPLIGLGVVIAPYSMPDTSMVIRHENQNCILFMTL